MINFVTETRIMSYIHTENRTRMRLCLAQPHCEKASSHEAHIAVSGFLMSMLDTLTIPERHRALQSAILSALSSQAMFSPGEAQGPQPLSCALAKHERGTARAAEGRRTAQTEARAIAGRAAGRLRE